MLKAFSACLLGFAMVGCGTASDAATDTVDAVDETHTTSMAGTWTSNEGEKRPAHLVLEQRSLSVKIVLQLEGHVCLSESVIEAKFSLSDGVDTTADIAGMHLRIEGEPDLDDLIGNFEAIEGGPCPGQGGWMQFKR